MNSIPQIQIFAIHIFFYILSIKDCFYYRIIIFHCFFTYFYDKYYIFFIFFCFFYKIFIFFMNINFFKNSLKILFFFTIILYFNNIYCTTKYTIQKCYIKIRNTSKKRGLFRFYKSL